jgi:hypothetical protein
MLKALELPTCPKCFVGVQKTLFEEFVIDFLAAGARLVSADAYAIATAVRSITALEDVEGLYSRGRLDDAQKVAALQATADLIENLKDLLRLIGAGYESRQSFRIQTGEAAQKSEKD